MKKHLLSLLVLFLLIACQLAAFAQSDTILSRYRTYQLSGPPVQNIAGILSGFSNGSGWTDIDYTDARRANWSLLNHLGRISALAVAWSDPRSSYFHDQRVRLVIDKALDLWIERRYQNSNWWSNEIGVPRIMRDILVLMHENLDPARLKGALSIMGQYKVRGTGANLIWSADLGLHYGALTHNDSLIRACVSLISNEIRITTGDGVQPDNSFLQHDARLQMYQYGAAFLQTNTRLAWELLGTPWAFKDDKIKILIDFTLNGWQWMARGIHSVPGTMDRSASRFGSLRNADLRETLPMLMQICPERENDLRAMAAFQNGGGEPLHGFRYFPYADFAAYQTAGFSFFLKTISTRTLSSESINSENLKGRLLNSGDAYIVKNGEEYFNLMPVWDWNRLPGVTSFTGAQKISRRNFVGAVSDGVSGLSVMDYVMQGEGADSISALKSWVCHDGVVVCLISGLKGKDGLNVFTTLDQCRWQRPVFIGSSGKVQIDSPANSQINNSMSDQTRELQEGNYSFDRVKWIQHAGIAYIFPDPQALYLHMGTDTGSWRSINLSEREGTVREKVFMPEMIHGSGDPAGVSYVLASCQKPSDAAALSQRPSWKILRNDGDCQAVAFVDGTTLSAFFKNGSLLLDNGQQLTVDQRCLLLLVGKKIYLSDPSHEGVTVNLIWDGKQTSIRLPKDGTSIFIK